MVLFRFIPPIGAMTPMGMEILGIFIGAFYAWLHGEMIWSSAIALILFGFTGYFDNVTAVFASAMGNGTIQIILWMLVYSSIMISSGLGEHIANRIVSFKLLRGRPWAITIAIMAAAYFTSMTGAIFAAIIICWNFVYLIAEKVGYEKGDRWIKMMLVGVAFSTCVGVMTLPFQTSVVATFGYLFAVSDGAYTSYDYLTYLIFALILGLTIMCVYLLLCRFVVRPDMGKLKGFEMPLGHRDPLDAKQKIAAWSLVGLLAITVVPGCIPNDTVRALFSTLGLPASILLVIGVVIFLRDREGKPFFTFKELANAGIYWDMVFMIAAAITLGLALSSEQAGLSATLLNLLSPMLAGATPYALALGIAVVGLIITNVINNSVCGAVLVPLSFSLSLSVGASPLALAAILGFISDIGLLMPSASPTGALLAANTEWITTKEIVPQALICAFSTFAAVAVVGIPLAYAMF